MARSSTLHIRISDRERATLAAMARLERLPIGTFIRRRLMLEADQRGIVPHTYVTNDKTANTYQGEGGLVSDN